MALTVSPVTQKLSIAGLLAGVEELMNILLTSGSESADEKSVAVEAAHYHLACGGQRVRAKIALHSALALDIGEKDALALAAAAELLHNASLVHDDVVDCEEFRRGSKTVVAKFGKTVAICTGDLLLSAAWLALAQVSVTDRLPALLGVLHARTAEAINGQCAEIRHRAVCGDSWELYEDVARKKSGALLGLPLQLSLIASGNADYAACALRCAESFAVAYQIIDDLNDADLDRENVDRPACFNAILLLEESNPTNIACEIARHRAHLRLCEATELATTLPANAGGLLLDLARDMIEQIS